MKAAAVSLIAVFVFSGSTGVLRGHDVKGERFLYDGARFLLNGEMLEGENLYEPTIVRVGQRVYVAMLEFTPGEGDRIVVAEWKDGELRDRRVVPGAAGQFRKPILTCDSTDHFWLSYEVLVGDHWQIRLQRSKAHTLFAGAAHVIADGGSSINHDAVALADGKLAFVWQGDEGGQWDVKFRIFDGKGNLGDVEVLSSENNRLGDWHPAIAVNGDGILMTVVWDAYDGESFSVRARTSDGVRWGDPVVVTNSRPFEGRADVVYDRGDRVFVSWEEGSINWGKEYRGPLKNGDKLNDEYGPVHRFRMVRLAQLGEDGSVSAVPFPMPTFEDAADRDGAVSNRERLGAFYERPKLIVDETNRLWVLYRHYYYPEVAKPGRPTSHVEEGWRLYGRCLSEKMWSEPIGLEPNQRDGMQRLAVLPETDGFSALWTTGRTHRGAARGSRGIAAVRFEAASELGFARADAYGALVKTHAEESEGNGQSELGFAPEGVAGEQYHLFLGDLHRHTDLSLCRVYFDGTMDDAYRYAIEAGQLDFLGITDHCRDIANGDAQSQLWWRSVKEVTRHRLENRFFPMFAFERSHGETDHNVISLRDDMLRPFQPPLKEFWDIIDTDTFTIPHNPIRPLRAFAFHDDKKRPLLEIYQACRDNPMTAQAHDGLGRGYHMGFIGSSDHMATRTSYACVWSPEGGAEPIFRSMQARRTYGATDRIRLVFRSGTHWMGEILKVAAMPMFQFEVDGTAPIERVDVIRSGSVMETFRNEKEGDAAKRFTGTFRGQGALDDTPWFYVHVVQTDGEQAWSSPIWLEPGN